MGIRTASTTLPEPGIGAAPAEWGPQRPAVRAAVVLLLIAGIASLHYATDPSRVVLHEVFNYLCFVPIILGAYWFGVPGGLAAAVLMSAAFIPHIRAAWAGNAPYAASRYAQVGAFHLLGFAVGALTASQRKLTAQYRDTAERLAKSHSEIVESHQQLRRADRLTALGEIAAGLAHEIRGPLAGVKGACDIILSRVQAGTPEGEFAHIATKELQRLEGLVEEFLAYARPHAPVLRPVHLGDLCRHTVLLLQPEADRRGVRLELTVAERSAAAVNADPEQLSQVLMNLVLNALQASETGTAVRIFHVATHDGVQIRVADQGRGIAPEHREQIFNPFFTTKERGTGLGLAIAQRIVGGHGGRIWFEAGAPTGTVFFVELPTPLGLAALTPGAETMEAP